MRPDLRVIDGGRKLTPEEELSLAFSDGEPWRTVRSIQIANLNARPRVSREWEKALDAQFDAILAHSERGDWGAVRDWLRQLAGTAMAWHERLEDVGGAA